MNKLLTGALLGLAIGLLIAPEKGEDMRDDIAETADKWKKRLNKMMGRTGMELSDLKKLLQSEVSGLKDDVRKRILTILEEGKTTANHIANGVS
ncbi:YtxH domain-containing protein [Chitinophagaceae bacterium MMS25-I14]